MKIIDTNIINRIIKENLILDDFYYLAPDVREESEIVEQMFGRKLPGKVRDISNESIYDEVSYLMNYKNMLNKYKGRSFYNMTGFGDISILAAAKTLKERLESQPKKLFKEMEEKLIIITEDDDLKKKIKKEFTNEKTGILDTNIFISSSI